MFAQPYIDVIHTITVDAAPNMPPDYWWVTAGVLFILGLTATIDAFTQIIPDLFILLGLTAIFITQTLFTSWDMALWRLRYALTAGFLIWLVNFLWYAKFRYDALGMGDAKWTILAVACFGLMPGIYAWGIGAILAVIYMVVARLFWHKVTKVTFAPFLFVGLCASLYWIRFRG